MMRPKRLLWQFYIPCLLIILLSLLVLTWYFSSTLRSSYLKQAEEDLSLIHISEPTRPY